MHIDKKDIIDLEDDELLSISEACHLLPRRPSPSTLWRWRVHGVAAGGKRVFLQCVKVGSTWCTTRRAFAEFVREQTEAALGQSPFGDDSPSERPESTERRLDERSLL